MRIGEIAVVGLNVAERQTFIRSICSHLELDTDDFTLGRFRVNDQFILHLYGIAAESQQQNAWDLIARKLLGFIVLFSWEDKSSYQQVRPIIDQIMARQDSAVVVAANLVGEGIPMPPEVFEDGITLTQDGKFLFCDVGNPSSARQVLLSLVNMLITRAE